MTKYVYAFAEGIKDLLGGEGANLAEMTNLGLPLPTWVHHHDRSVQEYRESGNLH
jgi:pyruvate,orthophosphate dikinase